MTDFIQVRRKDIEVVIPVLQYERDTAEKNQCSKAITQERDERIGRLRSSLAVSLEPRGFPYEEPGCINWDAPRNEEEAVAMALLSTNWLEKNAPHRLKTDRPAIVSDTPNAESVVGLSAFREKIRLIMLERPPRTEERNTYADGFTNGLLYVIQQIDSFECPKSAEPVVAGLAHR